MDKATVQVAPASPADCRDVARVHVASWREAYVDMLRPEYLASLSIDNREASWRQVLAEGRSELLVARLDGGVAGFISYGPSRDADAPPGRGEIWALYVSPDAWARGVGSALWRAARDHLLELGYPTISVWLLVGNARALRFYTSAGFREDAGIQKTFELGGAQVREARLAIQPAA